MDGIRQRLKVSDRDGERVGARVIGSRAMMRKPPGRQPANRTRKELWSSKEPKPPKPPPSRFAPKVFLSASPEAIQRLCEELATEAAGRFANRSSTTWSDVGISIAAQVRSGGHDLVNVDESDGFRRWQADLYHPRGTFSLVLIFREPASVEVTWQAGDVAYSARA